VPQQSERRVGFADQPGVCDFLITLVQTLEMPLTREQLMLTTRTNDGVFDRSIDVQFMRPRRKLQTDPSAPVAIQTVRDVAY
jgi:two-component system OmpR family response regulator